MKIGATDDFESQYMATFRGLAAPHGVFVEYAIDRAGRDIGLHLTQAKQAGGKIVTPALIWFQMKGIMPGTLGLEEFDAAKTVSVSLETSHLRFWYMNVQPTYLAVYVGCAERFLVIDIKDWVGRNFGDAILTHAGKTVTVKIDKKNVLDEHFFRHALDKNLIPALRGALKDSDDAEISRFLRDSGLVKALSLQAGREARVTVLKYMSKMRTELYFELQAASGDWSHLRTHWQYTMGDIAGAFPFISFKPEKMAVDRIIMQLNEDDVERAHSIVELYREDEEELFWDDEPLDYECLLPIGEGEYSYGEMHGGEQIVHTIGISLNETGERWGETLKVLEEAEIISVDTEPHSISVAPWHARDI